MQISVCDLVYVLSSVFACKVLVWLLSGILTNLRGAASYSVCTCFLSHGFVSLDHSHSLIVLMCFFSFRTNIWLIRFYSSRNQCLTLTVGLDSATPQ
jgi:hypothetical protein